MGFPDELSVLKVMPAENGDTIVLHIKNSEQEMRIHLNMADAQAVGSLLIDTVGAMLVSSYAFDTGVRH